MLNKKLIAELQDRAGKIGVALALPEYINRIDPVSQNHIVFEASQELLVLEQRRA